jgi:hypothetical protein
MVVLCVVVLWGFSLLSVVVFFASSHFGFLLVLRFVNFSSLHENCGMRVLKNTVWYYRYRGGKLHGLIPRDAGAASASSSTARQSGGHQKA